MIVPHMPIELKADPFEARAVLGAGSFGGVGTPKALIGAGLDERGAMDILDRGVELSLTLIDTAHSYADGESERMKSSSFDRVGLPIQLNLDQSNCTSFRASSCSK